MSSPLPKSIPRASKTTMIPYTLGTESLVTFEKHILPNNNKYLMGKRHTRSLPSA